MRFKKITIKNFMSVGNDPIVVEFDDLGDVVVIKGQNRDVSESSSNGAGKSLLIEAIVFALYDKTIRGLSKDECINNVNKKALVVDLEIDNLRIVRKRKPADLTLFVDGVDETLSTQAATQERIEQLIGKNFETFINIACFGQHNFFSFLSAKREVRRAIVENLMRLEKYRKFEDNAKRYVKLLKAHNQALTADLQAKVQFVAGKRDLIKKFEAQAAEKKASCEAKIKKLEEEMAYIVSLGIEAKMAAWDAYEQAQTGIGMLHAKKSEADGERASIQEEMEPIKSDLKLAKAERDKIEALRAQSICATCGQEIKLDHIQSGLGAASSRIEGLEAALVEPCTRLAKALKRIESLNKDLATLGEVRRPDIPRDDLFRRKLRLEQLGVDIERERVAYAEDPYVMLIAEATIDLETGIAAEAAARKDLAVWEELAPYYEFWVSGFGDNGIKSYIVENIIDVLNAQINYWLQFLIDNKIRVSFDRQLEPMIERPYNEEQLEYKQGSGGERKRIDLAVSLAFAHIMRMGSEGDSNLLFLDEIAEALDEDGIEGVYRVIRELAKDRKVFVITHHPILLSKLEGCRSLTFVKEGNFSRLL